MLHLPTPPRLSRAAPTRSISTELTPEGAVELSPSSQSSAHLPGTFTLADTSAHWRGSEFALFKLSKTAKCDIQDYILSRCEARNKDTNELTKPTGTKFVYILQLDDAGNMEQEALCVPTNPMTLASVYKFRNLPENGNNVEELTLPTATTTKMQIATPRRLPRSRGTKSFASLIANAKDEEFPLMDHELEITSDEIDDAQISPLAFSQTLGAIAEEPEVSYAAFVDVENYTPPRYCRDPHFTGHLECLGREKTDSYCSNAVDAELDLRQRFAMVHNGGDSPAQRRDWRILKWDYGQTMVHGQSSLRIEFPVDDTLESTDEDPIEELEDTSARFIQRLEAKYGPLTIANYVGSVQPQQGEVKCTEECMFKIDKFLEAHIERIPGYPEYASANDLGSAPSSLFDGIDDFSDDGKFAPVPVSPYTGPHFPEEELLKVSMKVFFHNAISDPRQILNTPHEEFIEHYVQRQQELKDRTARVKRSLFAKSGSAPEAAVSTPITPQTSEHADVKQAESADLLAATVSESAPVNSAALYFVPAVPVMEPAIIEVSLRPVSALTSRSSRDETSIITSVFSKRTSVTTKPSDDSVGSAYPRLLDALDLETEVSLPSAAFATTINDRRVVSMPILTSSVQCEQIPAHLPLAVVATTHPADDNPATPIRRDHLGQKCLSPILEVHTPQQLSPQLFLDPHESIILDDRADARQLPTEVQLQAIGAWVEAVLQSQAQMAVVDTQEYLPLFDNMRANDPRRHWKARAKISIRSRARTASEVTKKAAIRVVRSAKKLGRTFRCFAPVVVGARDSREAVARV